MGINNDYMYSYLGTREITCEEGPRMLMSLSLSTNKAKHFGDIIADKQRQTKQENQNKIRQKYLKLPFI